MSFFIAEGLIKQFLRDVDWGELDYLFVDTPPGTSDEHISVAQYLRCSTVDGAVVITTPQARAALMYLCTHRTTINCARHFDQKALNPLTYILNAVEIQQQNFIWVEFEIGEEI